MGDKNRFSAFADFLQSFEKDLRIADIAGGKGFLQKELRKREFRNIRTFDLHLDTSRSGVIDYCFSLFEPDMGQEFDLLVGLHPDAATDLIIFTAAKYHKPFVIVPCCVKKNKIPYRRGPKIKGKTNFDYWNEHLIRTSQNFGFRTEINFLPIEGRNLVISGSPI